MFAGFWLGKYTVTQQESEGVMGNNPSWFGQGKDRLGGITDTSRFPVEKVSWEDCQKFLEKLNVRGDLPKVLGKDGTFALPHEARSFRRAHRTRAPAKVF